MRVGIIGGTGAMGTFFRGVFERAGHDVIWSGQTTPLSNTELAAQCDLVMVSVPIQRTVEVIREIAPVLGPDQVLCDVTSIKGEPVRAMLESGAQVIGTHPMFGPGVPSLRGQTIIVTPARCDERTLEDLTGLFKSEGALVTITTPEVHDRMMAVVQGLTHFATLCLAETMRRMNTDFDEILAFMSPIYRIELDIIGRILGQDPALYGAILGMNPGTPEVVAVFEDAVASLSDIVRTGDSSAFEDFFTSNSAAFSSYIPQATRESDRLIETLVKP